MLIINSLAKMAPFNQRCTIIKGYNKIANFYSPLASSTSAPNWWHSVWQLETIADCTSLLFTLCMVLWFGSLALLTSLSDMFIDFKSRLNCRLPSVANKFRWAPQSAENETCRPVLELELFQMLFYKITTQELVYIDHSRQTRMAFNLCVSFGWQLKLIVICSFESNVR